MIFKYKKISKYQFFILFVAVLSCASAKVLAKEIFHDSFESGTLKSIWRQSDRNPGPNTLIEISDKAAWDSNKSILLYDNDPKQAVTLDYTGKLPQSGEISAYLMFPKSSKGNSNSNRAYTCIQLLGTKSKSMPVLISIGAPSMNASIRMRKNGKGVKVAVLPKVVVFDSWVKLRIAWQWDGKSPEGKIRVTIGDKETDVFAYPASKLSRLRLVSGWSSAVNNSVYYDYISIRSGTSFLASSSRKSSSVFKVERIKTIFSDNFNKTDKNDSKLPEGWSNWQPVTDNGKAVYDRIYGRNNNKSICFINSMRCWWQRKQKIIAGKTYRLSGWIKVEKVSKGKVGLHIIPKLISKNSGKEIFLSKHGSTNEIRLLPGFWRYLEVFWTAPASGYYPDGKLTGVDIAFFANNLKGKAWCDDVALDEVIVKKPFRENFLIKEQALKKWQFFAHSGLEGIAGISYMSSGFADKGAISVTHYKGKTGAFSVSTMLDSKILGAMRQWTLIAHAEAKGNGKPSISVQQLSVDDEILLDSRERPSKRNGGGWFEHKLTFSILPNTKKLRLRLINSAENSVIFDNVWLRPATVHEMTATVKNKKLPVWMQIFPADSFAAIDGCPAVISVPAGQTTAFCIQLAGDNKAGEITIVDVDMPDWLTFRTAQIATYGRAPLEYEKISSARQGRITYRFKNPYNWQRLMVSGNPNPYQGILIVVNSKVAAGTRDQIIIRTSLGKIKGEERKIPLVVNKPLVMQQRLKKFNTGLASLGWLNVRDSAARKELYQTYVNSGIRIGSMHQTHGFAVDTMRVVGFTPMRWPIDPHKLSAYRYLPKNQRPDLAILANGKTTRHNIALGQMLNDPVLHQAYKKYLAGALKMLPEFSKYVFSDVEFWGDGRTSKSCFHPSTIKAFRKYAGIQESTKLDSETILKKHYRQWANFRNWLTAELHGLKRRIMREIRPDLKLLAYDYSLAKGGKAPFGPEAPMNTLLYDPHIDIHCISYYNYEGIKFLDHVDNDVKHLKKPVWAMPYIVESVTAVKRPDWRYNHPSKKELRLEIVAAAASGAKGFLPWVGRLLDGDRLQAFNEGVNAVANYEVFYMNGKRVDEKVVLSNPNSNVRHRVHELKGELLMTLFNCSNNELKITFEFNNKQQSATVKAHDFKQVELK